MIKNWCLLFSILCAFCGISQEYINYSEKDGLPSNHVYKITQDQEGFIWIATNQGVAKFNGNEFKTFTTKDGLPTNDVWNLFPTRDGKIWYASKSKSLGYIFKDKVYDFPSQDGSVMSPIYVNFNGKEVMVNGSNSSYKFHKNSWKPVQIDSIYRKFSIPLLNSKYDLLYNKDNQINLVRFDNKKESIDNSEGFLYTYARSQITDSLYFTINDYSYNILNLNSKKISRYSYENELGLNRLELVRLNLIGDQIQITGENVVGILDNNQSIKEKYHLPKSLGSHNSYIDKENNIWAATFSNGMYKYNVNDFKIKKEFSDEKVQDIKEINGKIYCIVNDNGFYVYDESIESFSLDLKSPQFLYDMTHIEQTGTTYYMTDHEIITIHNGKQLTFTFPFKNERARSLVYHKNLLYSHQTSGIAALNPYSLDIVELYEQPGSRCLIEFKSQLFIGTNAGLKLFEKGEIKNINLDLEEFNYPINAISVIDNDHILFTTDGYGAYLTNLSRVTKLEGSDYLSCNNPFFKDDELYLPTNQGIYSYSYVNKTFELQKIWNNTNGLPTNNINGIEKIEDQLLVATNQGLIHLPLDYSSSTQLLNIYIDKSSYNGTNIDHTSSEKYVANNSLGFTIKAIDYSPNATLEYQFKLAPIQKEWTTTSSKNLTFADLSPHEYELQIKSGKIIKTFEFTITSRWYQSWIFYTALLFLFAAAVIYITHYLSHKAEKKRNEELFKSKELSELQLKALRSQMNPHFVFNSLTAIQYYMNENDFETSDTYLVKFSRLIREFFELSKEQLVSIEREIQLLSNYLSLEQLRFKGKLNYILEIDPELDRSDKLPSMLLQPIVENAVNHGIFHKETAGTILLKFTRVSSNQIKICIQDDGKGYQSSKKDDRFKSTSVLEDRLKYLRESGTWEITLERNDAFPEKTDIGHKVSFNIKRMIDEEI